jgi:hypothetical protein
VSAPRRKLPVLNATPSAESAEPRPPWHWVGFGTVAIFAAWLPLALVAQSICARLSRLPASSSPAETAANFYALPAIERAKELASIALPHGLALSLASFAGGFLVGRYGAPAGAREAALGGLMAGIVAVILAFSSGGISWPSLVVAAVATGFAAWGGRRAAASRAGLVP